jgi:hypothetical protein
MSEPVFRLCLQYADGSSLPIRAGGPAEQDFVILCKAHILKHGVGLLKTEAQVATAIEQGLKDALMDVKRDSRRFL